MRLFAVFTLALCALQILPVTKAAHAQGVKMMPNYYYDISTARPDTPNDGDFIIRLASPGGVTGCYKVKPAEIEMIDAGAVMFIKLEEGEIELDKKMTYGQFGCDMNTGGQHIDILLNKNTLEQSGTNKIAISSKTIGKLFDIQVVTDDNKVTLISEIKTGVRLPEDEKVKTMVHWFYPVNTIMVFANNMDKNAEIKKQVGVVASSRGLTPLNIMLEGFTQPEKYMYFVDTKNVIGDTLKEGDVISIGSISTSETFEGSNGPYNKREKQAVFAKRPTQMD